MRTLEYGTGHEKTLLFLPCTAEPEWAFTDSVGLLSQDYHVMQIVYDGHGETGEDFISVETTVDENQAKFSDFQSRLHSRLYRLCAGLYLWDKRCKGLCSGFLAVTRYLVRYESHGPPVG